MNVQTASRLQISIEPAYMDDTNRSFYVLPEDLVPRPQQGYVQPTPQEVDLQFSWSNEPTFSFSVMRKSTGDTLFDTSGSVLVYENQFIEFVSQMPEDYNLYGMGERIHGLRLGNNFTATFWAADAGDPVSVPMAKQRCPRSGDKTHANCVVVLVRLIVTSTATTHST